MANIINIYTLSNNYTVEISQTGPWIIATLFSPSHELIIEGLKSFSDEGVLLNEILINKWTFENERPTVISSKVPPSPVITPTIETKLYSINGKVADESLTPLVGIDISINTKGLNRNISVKSDEEGEYTLKVTLETLISTGLPNERPSIIFKDPTNKYSEISIIPFKQDGNLINNPSPVSMKLQKKDMEDVKIKFKQNASSVAIKATKTLPKSPEQALVNFIKQQVKILINIILPVILTLLAAFGIDQLNKFLKGSKSGYCPSKKKLDELIKVRNQIIRQLNEMSKSLDVLIIAVGIVQGLIGVLQVAIGIILLLPIPALTVTTGIITTFSSVAEALKKILDKFSTVSITVLMALLIVKSVIALILALLKILDSLILACDPNANLDGLNDALTIIDNELNNNDDNLDGSSLTRRVNGFTLSTQILETNAVGNLKRKQAIAKNSQGVIMISGEPSFSADEQVLLDELEFYIKSNNLKAQ